MTVRNLTAVALLVLGSSAALADGTGAIVGAIAVQQMINASAESRAAELRDSCKALEARIVGKAETPAVLADRRLFLTQECPNVLGGESAVPSETQRLCRKILDRMNDPSVREDARRDIAVSYRSQCGVGH